MELPRTRVSYSDVRDELASIGTDELEQHLHDVVAEERRAAGRKAAVLAELVKRNAHTRDGWRSTHDFVAYRTRCSVREATQLAAVIDGADDIPEALNQLVSGRLSIEKAALCASIVTDDNRDNASRCEADRVNIIRDKTYDRARSYAARQRHKLTPPEARPTDAERHRSDRGVKFIKHRDGTRSVLVTGDAEGIERIQRCLQPTIDEHTRSDRANRETNELAGLPRRTSTQRRYDALLEVLSAGANAVGSHTGQPVADIVAILREDTHGSLQAQLQDGTPFLTETLNRLACSAHLVAMIINADGREISLGTTSRTPSQTQRRAIRARDRRCRFPKCQQTHRLQAHHIQHWEHGGHTSLENLVSLCEQHHHAIHEGGFTVRRSATGQLEYIRPDGTLLATDTYATEADEELPLTG